MLKCCVAVVIGVAVALGPAGVAPSWIRPGAPPPFDTWRAALVEEAVDRGFERTFVEAALGNLQALRQVVELDRTQSQAPQPLEAYLRARVTPELEARGREVVGRHVATLDRVQNHFGVQPRFVAAIWGAETGYGEFVGSMPVLQALATLAWEPRRSAYFRGELFNALRILQTGPVTRRVMNGSWAGAMGQPQFMPSSYIEYAVDFDGDGDRDIWTSVPDTLASIANYLSRFGWRPDETWGREVVAAPATRVPAEAVVPFRTRGCGALRSLTERRPMRDWSAWGVRAVDGRPLPDDHVEASLLTLDGRTFLVQRNYETLLVYNCSHRYALSVSLLADRIG
jgi:membrane-bound lytic murein transglycosylase B